MSSLPPPFSLSSSSSSSSLAPSLPGQDDNDENEEKEDEDNDGDEDDDTIDSDIMDTFVSSFNHIVASAAAAVASLVNSLPVETISALPPNTRRANRKRGREEFGRQLMYDYFQPDPRSGSITYSPEDFRRRYRMHRPLFEQILADLAHHNRFFTQTADCFHVRGLI